MPWTLHTTIQSRPFLLDIAFLQSLSNVDDHERALQQRLIQQLKALWRLKAPVLWQDGKVHAELCLNYQSVHQTPCSIFHQC